MKKRVLLASAVLLSTFAMAQRSELRDAERALDDGNVQEAMSTLESLSSSIESADEKYIAEYYFLRGKAFADMAKKGMEPTTNYEKSIETFEKLIAFEEGYKDKYTEDAREIMAGMSADIVNSAVEDNKNQDFDAAAKKLYMAYKLDDNPDYLYFAASSAVNAGDYDTALGYYQELKDMGYTGETTQYLATNKETGEVENLGSEQQQTIMVKAGTHTDPKTETTESRMPEIVKNIALIYTQKGEKEKAIQAIQEAREANPDDVNLLLTEANLYIEMGDKEKFRQLMEEAVQKDPNNPVLYYNLGVVMAEQGDKEKAMEYYKKSLELDPKSENTYLNMASVILSEENEIVEEMNSLGNTAADNKRYDELKQKREDIYREAAPYLEDLLEVNPNNVDAARTLMNIYANIGESEKFKEMKEKLASMEQ
ncbi:tetratricopeptide repeat protein [Robertkochia aurantiaca]|uniref:tetratricopeptide repeat protein n=1 Tax=Robertkochia aurantiaca TaxID=2873700 RepID=UPI001CCD9240|nr:tetratricopeptide repeat protein [Robertkochia sp. 3YJGBD-33]